MGRRQTPAEIVDDRFQWIITQEESQLSANDLVIYWIVMTRCEMDANGFDNVFNQLLSKSKLEFLIESLAALGERDLANAFQIAHDRLDSMAFFADDSMMLWDLGDSVDEIGFLDDVESMVRESDRLWELDSKLQHLVSRY